MGTLLSRSLWLLLSDPAVRPLPRQRPPLELTSLKVRHNKKAPERKKTTDTHTHTHTQNGGALPADFVVSSALWDSLQTSLACQVRWEVHSSPSRSARKKQASTWRPMWKSKLNLPSARLNPLTRLPFDPIEYIVAQLDHKLWRNVTGL